MKVTLAMQVLKCLYEDKQVATIKNEPLFFTTRVENIISKLRNQDKIKIDTLKVKTSNSWYGKYQLVRTKKNIEKVTKILNQSSNKNTFDNRGN
ncbi:MAG: hypothetical protein DRG78_17180 [Epsilonproteobacteria bacterium]|nr:MAG: hypothetical protein DRG78_17180 [Campylobacterota bacterium]